jgi:Outer membrane protein beta-barrel domain
MSPCNPQLSFPQQPSPYQPSRSKPILSLILLLSATVPLNIQAQAMPNASRTAEISAFGGVDIASPDFDHPHDTGAAVGVDYARFFRWPVYPAVELRGNFTSGPTVNEDSYLIGLRAQTDFRRHFHPYVDFLAGIGSIKYAHPLNPHDTHDQGTAYSFGAGVDIDLVRHFQARIDFQRQSWNFGLNGDFKPSGGDYTLTPSVLLIGINYRIPFHPWVRQQDLH